jgi:biopolymer transport protein ExbB
MNGFNLKHFWEQGDGFSHFIAVILLIMSILSWGIIVLRGSMWWRMRHLSQTVDVFWQAVQTPHPQNAMQALNTIQYLDKEQLLYSLAKISQAYTEQSNVTRVKNTEQQLERQLASAMRQSENRLEQGLTLLATVASSAPFVGLLGTVWGIYRTLTSVAAEGQLDINAIIGPVGEALIMTAFGLAVALPALFAYNFFARSNQTLSAEIEAFTHDLLNSHANQHLTAKD